jgi:GMP synthase (glutamine-hydrolysing)
VRTLCVVFEEDAGPGVFAGATELVRWAPAEGPPPEGPWDAVVVLGGSQNPDEDERFPELARVRALLAELLRDDVPVLGVCLGAELLTQAAGGEAPPLGWTQLGMCPVARTNADDPVLGALPREFEALQWHSYGMTLPPGATALAVTDGRVDAWRRGRAWAVQFHPEVTAEIISAWIEAEPAKVDDPEALLAAVPAGEPQGARLFEAFLRAAAAKTP